LAQWNCGDDSLFLRFVPRPFLEMSGSAAHYPANFDIQGALASPAQDAIASVPGTVCYNSEVMNQDDLEASEVAEGASPHVEDVCALQLSSLYKSPPFSPKSLLPPLTWVPRYWRSLQGQSSEEDARILGTLPNSIKGDAIAGLTVGIMLVPQCLAFALLAGLPVHVGLYSSFAPLLVYALFGTMRQVQTGPTAVMCLLTGQALDSMGLESQALRVAGASLMALMVGGISVVLGILRFGGIVDFMSHTVMSAFCTASGVTIVTSQLKDLLGLRYPRTHYWWEEVESVATRLGEIQVPTAILGCCLLVVLLVLKYWKSAGSTEARQNHRLWSFFPKDKNSMPFRALKLLADLSSFLAVFVGSLVAWALREAGVDGVRLVGDVHADGFIFVMPGRGYYSELFGSSTLFVSAAVIATIGFLETIAVGGKFAAQYRYDYEPNQDFIALGLSNVASAFMSGFPVTGGFSRTAVNVAFGATSLFSSAISSTLVLGAMYFLLPVISKVPRTCLAPIIIQGAIAVIDIHEFKVAFRSRPSEFLVMLSTLVVSLALTVKEGLLVGFVLSVLKTLRDISDPNLAMVVRVQDTWRDVRHFPLGEQPANAVVVRMDARLHFANTRKLKEFCIRALQVREASGDRGEYLIIDGKSINGIDLTGCEMLAVLAESLKTRGQRLIIANLKAPIANDLHTANLVHAIHKQGGRLCLEIQHALDVICQAEPDWCAEESKLSSLIASAATIGKASTTTGCVNLLKSNLGKAA